MSDRPANESPKLSVCLITYNRAPYLIRLLADLFQTRPFSFPFEILICDNHSTDQTVEAVAAWQAQHPEIRHVRQSFNVGPENNLSSAYRLARGEFCVYLADDDRLIPEAVTEIVRYMEARPNIAVVHAPWELWDDINKRAFQQFYSMPEEKIFPKSAAVELFNMLMHNRIFPETCVYRASALHRSYTVPFNAYGPFVQLAHVLDYGDVAFLPRSFYRQVILGYAPSPTEHLGTQWTINRRDNFVAGFEYFAQKAFQHFGASGVPPAQVEMLRSMVLTFNVNQLGHGIRLMMGTKNYRGAYEFMVRQQANGACDETKAAEMRAFLMQRAGIQALIETFEAISVLDELAVFGVPNPDQTLTLIREQRPELPVRTLTAETVRGVANPEAMMVLAGTEEHRIQLLQAGFLPGLVINENDLNRMFLL